MKTILVIDDNEMYRFVLATWLEDHGFHPITAEGGFEGMQLAQSHRPDLIFCDVNMPFVNGLEVLHAIRSDPKTAGIPFYFLTSELDFALHAEHLGASGLLNKGVDPETLLQLLKTLEPAPMSR